MVARRRGTEGGIVEEPDGVQGGIDGLWARPGQDDRKAVEEVRKPMAEIFRNIGRKGRVGIDGSTVEHINGCATGLGEKVVKELHGLAGGGVGGGEGASSVLPSVCCGNLRLKGQRWVSV